MNLIVGNVYIYFIYMTILFLFYISSEYKAKPAWREVEDLFEKNRRFFVCNICRENCDKNNKHIICMKCNFFREKV